MIFSFHVRRMSIEKRSGQGKGFLIGYARVSTEDQNLEMQLRALKDVGCKRVFTDKASGNASDRTGLKEALSHLRESDTLVVWKLDRLGRSVKGLVDLVLELESQHVHFRSLTDSIDTKTPAGRFFFHVMASLAQMERELIVERTHAGLNAARQQGRVGGRKRLMTEKKMSAARKLLAGGTPPREVAQSLGISFPTLYRWIPAGSSGIEGAAYAK
jgi:DNA invertase Pin-like site-specific DNA recombinase